MNKKALSEKTYGYQSPGQGAASESGSHHNESYIRKLIQEELRLAGGKLTEHHQTGYSTSESESNGCTEAAGAPSYPSSTGSTSGSSTPNGAGSSSSSAAGATPGASGSSPGNSTDSPPPLSAPDPEQYPMSLLLEAYKEDRARELALESERSEAASQHKLVAITESMANPHMSDSNSAPLTDDKEFAPNFGEQPRNEVAELEVISTPPDYHIRPESAPRAASVDIPLPAHLGSFGNALDRHNARLKCCGHGSAESVMLEVVLGEDDRTRVGNTDEYPWCCICSLLITAADDSFFIGTGWLVAPRVVLTAGHCVHIGNHGGWAKRIEVIPGRDATERPFGSATTSALRSVRGWTIDKNRDFDYGAILLPEDRAFGRQLGWFGYAARDDDHFDDITLNLSGYPGDKVGTLSGTQWFHSQNVRSLQERQITYTIDTYGGQSGAPVWEMTSDGSRYGVGIHTWGMTDVSNGATRITGDVFDNIVSWVGQAP